MLLFFDYIISSIFTWKSKDWIDKIGRTKTVFISCLGVSMFSMLLSISYNIVQFFLVIVGVSSSYYVFRIAFKTTLMDEAKINIRGEQIGFGKTLQGLGDVLGPLIGGFLIDFVSLRSAFIFSGLFGLLATILVLRINQI